MIKKPKENIKVGDTVKIVDLKGMSKYTFYRKLLKFRDYPLTVRRVKPTGGILFNELFIGHNITGEE